MPRIQRSANRQAVFTLRRAHLRLIQAVLRFLAASSTVFAFVAAATASAQTSGGAIRGTVSDPSGAMVPGAGITIEEVSTSENWRLVSSSAGLYNEIGRASCRER